MSKRYQIFVSSTYEDLIGERNQVIEAVLNMGHIPVGMEMFSADDEDQWATIKREIDRSDYYLLIVAHRYGSIIKSEGGISYTEKEFNYAIESGVPRIAFVIKKGAIWNPEYVDRGPILKKLEAFKSKVRGKPIDFWMDAPDLGKKVAIALPKLIANSPRPGWERSTTGGAQVAATMSRLVDENAQLRAEVEQLRLFAGEKVPVLGCEFVGDAAKSIGDLLQVTTPKPMNLQEFGKDSLVHIEKLVVKIGILQREIAVIPYREIIDEVTLSFSAMDREYKFRKSRLQRVISDLIILGASAPKEKWNFKDLRMDFIIENVFENIQPEPVSGSDFNKYVAFRSLEFLLDSLKLGLDSHNYVEENVKVNLRLFNTSRSPAENLTIRLDFPADTRIGDFEFDRRKRKKLEKNGNYTKKIELLSSQDVATLSEFVIGLEEGVPQIDFTVRVTADYPSKRGMSFASARQDVLEG
ncbi:DUF4062 domain-containing protein [Deinococcus arenicola]|uniref:DUF4062 domain-containing protein n=1 Tax=Deinococcus arenicola TaxID=2994950 RepID=A0ABU4DV69_9DEIO|nr:DUF4062 domain-containing protein [Deinococcus sp. ZS9-10]MDV6376332.1 DUF4062 domain-containing protein [Deinococcus sp. ZS9-10]